jgi:hypothetical protein
MWDDAEFLCAFCGNTNYIRVDPSAGFEQSFIEDCQTCCQPNRVYVTIDPDTLTSEVWAEMEEE